MKTAQVSARRLVEFSDAVCADEPDFDRLTKELRELFYHLGSEAPETIRAVEKLVVGEADGDYVTFRGPYYGDTPHTIGDCINAMESIESLPRILVQHTKAELPGLDAEDWQNVLRLATIVSSLMPYCGRAISVDDGR